ncbi:uncharacterized protein [Primulina huaijiensis]|uniref:uncharacterized protein n=1 Tax=Primulina huaijiensis TaxID=1492673 RepID=UPI003CC6E551
MDGVIFGDKWIPSMQAFIGEPLVPWEREVIVSALIQDDSSGHALFFCVAIKHLWKNTSFAQVLRGNSHTDTLELCLWLKDQFSKTEFEEVAIHTWAVWKEKQKYLHGDRKKSLADNVSWSYEILSDFKKARTKEKIEDASNKSNPERLWNPPRLRTLKLNVDASVDEDRHHFSIGGALRDKQGRLFLVFGKQINQPISVVHGEFLAIREGIILLHDKGFTDVRVAIDSLLAVQAVTTIRDHISYTGQCAADIRERMSEFGISELIHVRSTTNNIAHDIARFVKISLRTFINCHLLQMARIEIPSIQILAAAIIRTYVLDSY